MGERMSSNWIWLASVSLTILISGCLDYASDEDFGSDGGDSDLEGVPEWEMGQWWQYDVSLWGEITFVVVQGDNDRWTLGTSDKDFSWFNELENFDLMGEIAKNDLSIIQDDDRINFLEFPMEGGNNWVINRGGEIHTISSSFENESYLLVGHHGEGWKSLEYTYDPEIEWLAGFTEFGEGGNEIFSMKLLDSGFNYQGKIAEWSSDKKGGHSHEWIVGNPHIKFSINSSYTDLWIEYEWVCKNQNGGFGLVVLSDVFGVGHFEERTGGCTTEKDNIVIANPREGDWEIHSIFFASQSSVYFGIQAYARTLDMVDTS